MNVEQNLELHCALGLKINLPYSLTRDVTEDNPFTEWPMIIREVLNPFLDYLDTVTNKKPKIEVHQWSAGIHTNGKNDIPHVHFNLHCEHVPNGFNFLTNYKYYYLNTYLRNKMRIPKNKTSLSTSCKSQVADLLHEKTSRHFKDFKHSVKMAQMTDLKGWLAYPFKECTDPTNDWKVYLNSKIEPYSSLELISYGSGIYLASINQHQKAEAKEQIKLEKWGDFCAYMDALMLTASNQHLRDLRGITLVALDYFRAKPERTSVNAVITMCKDYAFKRGIWTNEQILDKYQIV